MNLGQIRTQVRKRLGDATSAFWTDAELNSYINDGCRDISFRTKCLRANGYISSESCEANLVAAASNEYPLASNFTNIYAVLEVYFHENGENWIRLEPTTREELDEENIAWRGNVGYTYTDTGSGVVTYNYNSKPSTPQKYYWSREEDILGLDPPPNDDNAVSNGIRVYYALKHADMTDDSDIPTVPEPLHLAVIFYAVAVGFEDRGWGDRANDQWTKYYTRLRDYKIERNREREDDEIISINYKGI
jgi:hypothetical protein